MVRLSQAVFDPVGLTDHVEAHLPGINSVPVSRLFGELDTVIGQDRMDAIRDRLEQMFEELPGGLAICPVDEVGDCKLALPVNADEKTQLALRSLQLGNIPFSSFAVQTTAGHWICNRPACPH